MTTTLSLIKLIEDHALNYCLGNALERLLESKGDDTVKLREALWFIEREIQRREDKHKQTELTKKKKEADAKESKQEVKDDLHKQVQEWYRKMMESKESWMKSEQKPLTWVQPPHTPAGPCPASTSSLPLESISPPPPKPSCADCEGTGKIKCNLTKDGSASYYQDCPTCHGGTHKHPPRTEPCCECGNDYPAIDLVKHGHIFCPPCREAEAKREATWQKRGQQYAQ